jgi:hypothetical protein
MANCESGKKKYTRGLLCSDATLRRTQKKVHKLAEGLGFSSLPTVEEGNVWCWGDAEGNLRRRRTVMFTKYMSRHDAISSLRKNLGNWQKRGIWRALILGERQ